MATAQNLKKSIEQKRSTKTDLYIDIFFREVLKMGRCFSDICLAHYYTVASIVSHYIQHNLINSLRLLDS